VNAIGSRVQVMGHSYGALLAVEAARLTPKIAGLLLYDPPMISFGSDELPAGTVEQLEALVAQARRDEAVGWLLQRLGRSPAEVEVLRADPTWAGRVASIHTVAREMRAGGVEYRFDWSGFENIQQPTLLLQGELSPARLRASVAAIHALMPDSRVVTLEGQGHAALITAPNEVAAKVLKFLRSDRD